MADRTFKFTPEQLDEIEVNYRDILSNPLELIDFTFGVRDEAEGGGLIVNATIRNSDKVTTEEMEHKAVELIKEFERGMACSGILAKCGGTELFPRGMDGTITINGKKMVFPKSWLD